MEKERPAWLNEAFLSTSLQGGEGNRPPVSVTNMSVTPAVAAGNNYMSHIYRVQAEYRVGKVDRSGSFIVKAVLEKGAVTEMVDFDALADKEPRLYKELLPLFKQKFGFDLAPEVFHCPLKNGLVLKDLNQDGYVMQNKFEQLDFAHCKLVLQTVAKFHAASVALHRDHPELISTLGRENIYVHGEAFEQGTKPWMKSSTMIVAKMVADLKGSKEATELLIKRSDHLAESAVRICKPRDNLLNVLNHGDLWTNNMLFKHDGSGEPEDVKLIDFQIMRYGSPAIDVLYFIWMSANVDVRENRLQDLCDIYLHTLNKTLEEIECTERLTKEDFQKDLVDAIDWAITVICNILPFTICEAQNIINMEEVNAEDIKTGQPDERFVKVYTGKHYKAILPNIMEHFQAWVSSIEK